MVAPCLRLKHRPRHRAWVVVAAGAATAAGEETAAVGAGGGASLWVLPRSRTGAVLTAMVVMVVIGSLSPASAAAVQPPMQRPLALATVALGVQVAQQGRRLLLLAREVALVAATALLGLLHLQAASGVVLVALDLLLALRQQPAAAASASKPISY